jgi:ATP-dependent Clp protease ATP-binding subunit ClpA
MLDRMAADARAVVADADTDARRLGHRWIGCEHLLLATCGHRDATGAALNRMGVTPDAVETAVRTIVDSAPAGLDAQALAAIGIDLEAVQRRVEAVFGPGALTRPVPKCRRGRRHRRRCERVDDALPFTPRAKEVLQLAVQGARADGRAEADVADLASALADVAGSMSRRILEFLGVEPQQVRRDIGNYRRAG